MAFFFSEFWMNPKGNNKLMSNSESKQLEPHVVARLRQSKGVYEAVERDLGYEAGRPWAEDHAGYEELRRFSLARTGPFALTEVLGPDDGKPNAASNFVGAITGNKSIGRDYCDAFWGAYAETSSPSYKFVYGFAEAARDVFEQFEEEDG